MENNNDNPSITNDTDIDGSYANLEREMESIEIDSQCELDGTY